MRTRLMLLAGQTIALGLGCAFLVVPASSLFLVRYGAARLPYVYLAVGACGVLASWAMARAQRRWTLQRLGLTVLCSLGGAVLLAWVLLVAGDLDWVTFPLLVLFPLSIPIGFMLVGAQASRLLDLQQMKARFPRVVAGFTVGFAVGGLVAAWLVGVTGDARQLLAIDVAAFAAFAALLFATAQHHPAQLRIRPERPAAPAPPGAPRRWQFGSRLVLLMLVYQIASAAATQLLDFMVWERASVRYPKSTDLAAFMGIFGAVLNIVSIAFVVTLAGRLLRRYGVAFGLAANPGIVIAVVAAGLITGVAGGTAATGYFLLVCSAQVGDIAVTDGCTRTSIVATYQALEPAERLRAQTSVEAAGAPFAIACVGGLILIFDAAGFGILWFSVAAAVLGVCWLVVAVVSHREYGRRLRASLARRDWDPTALRLDDAASQSVVDGLLRSADLRDVRLGVDVLAAAESAQLRPAAHALLANQDVARRRLGVAAAAQLRDPETARLLAELARDETAPEELRLDAAEAAARAGADPAVLEGALTADDPTVRLTAAALLGTGSGPAAGRARALCKAALMSTDAALVDAALVAVARQPNAGYVEALLARAQTDGERPAVASAVAAHLGLPGCDAQAVLGGPDRAVGRAIGRAVAAGGQRLPADAAARLVSAECARARRAAAAGTALAGASAAEHLRRALDDEIAECTRSVHDLLAAAHGAAWFRRAVAQLASEVDGERALAIETLELELGHASAELVLPLVDPVPPSETRRVHLASGSEARSVDDWLTELVVDPDRYWRDGWLRACALHAAAALAPETAARTAATLPDARDPVVAETARWVLARA
jgi:hypothetical protein